MTTGDWPEEILVSVNLWEKIGGANIIQLALGEECIFIALQVAPDASTEKNRKYEVISRQVSKPDLIIGLHDVQIEFRNIYRSEKRFSDNVTNAFISIFSTASYRTCSTQPRSKSIQKTDIWGLNIFRSCDNIGKAAIVFKHIT